MRVLVAEDFEILARAIATGLRREGMAVDVVLDGEDALESLAVTRPGRTVNDIPSRASVAPNRLRSPLTAMVASFMWSSFSAGK